MAWEDAFLEILKSWNILSFPNLILLATLYFIGKQAMRIVEEHRDLRKRVISLEAKIRVYEETGIIQNVYTELRGKKRL